MSEGLSIPQSLHFPCSEIETTFLSLIPILMCAETFVQCSQVNTFQSMQGNAAEVLLCSGFVFGEELEFSLLFLASESLRE